MAAKRSARQIALEVLDRIEYHGAYANLEIQKALQGAVTKQDRAFITELVYGSVRMKLALKWVISQFVSIRWKKIDENIRLVLMLGVYQLLFMDKVPARAVCNEMVDLTKAISNKGAAGFVNGVLRNIVRNSHRISWPDKEKDPVKYLSVTYSHPQWIVEKWFERFGAADTEALCKYNNLPATLTARTNSLKTTISQVKSSLEMENVTVTQGKLLPEALHIKAQKRIDELETFKTGKFILQDESSMLPAKILCPEPGSFVIDGCAAPGGKTTQLAEIMGNSGKILACDIHQHKLRLVEINKERLGCHIVEERLMDARKLGDLFPNQVDYLLLDVPCSGLGVLSRRADARWRKSPDDILHMVELQWQIFTKASRCLKKNGVLVYSTCTIEREENENMINRFLAKFEDFKAVDITPYLPFTLTNADAETARNGYLQMLPQHYGVDGFFVAKIRRLGDC